MMNDPIISPWIFYLIHVVDVTGELLGIIGALSVGCALFTIFSIYDSEFLRNDFQEACIKHKKKTFTICIISMLLLVLIPSRETMYQMLITSQVTPNNVEYIKNEVKGTGHDIVQGITEASLKLIKESKEKAND